MFYKMSTWFPCVLLFCVYIAIASELYDICMPDSKVHGANLGPIWGQQDPGGPHVGPMNLAVWMV